MIDTAIADAFEGLCLPHEVRVEHDGAIEIRYRNGMVFKGWWSTESEQPAYVGKWVKLEPRFKA